MPLIPALGRLRQEDLEFEASLSYIVRTCFKRPKQTTSTKRTPKQKKLHSLIFSCLQIVIPTQGQGFDCISYSSYKLNINLNRLNLVSGF
jgi:hypothetical protein